MSCAMPITMPKEFPSGGTTLLKIICWLNIGRTFTKKSKIKNEKIVRRGFINLENLN
jgi:hypothetical protein